MTLVLATAVVLLLAAQAGAARWPTPPAWWLRQAACVHHFETYGLEGAAAWHDRRNGYSRGGLQFLRGTWQSVGGHGDPADASRGEQLYRAWLLWLRSGRSWAQWSTHTVCGLR